MDEGVGFAEVRGSFAAAAPFFLVWPYCVLSSKKTFMDCFIFFQLYISFRLLVGTRVSKTNTCLTYQGVRDMGNTDSRTYISKQINISPFYAGPRVALDYQVRKAL